MKRVISISLLMTLAILVYQIPCFPQNKIKRTHSSSVKNKISGKSLSHKRNTLSVGSFLCKPDGEKGFTEFKRNSQIIKILKQDGFTLISKKITKDILGETGEDIINTITTITEFVFAKNDIKVKWDLHTLDHSPGYEDICLIVINFSNKSLRNTFLSSLKSDGFYKTEFGFYENKHGHFVDFKGNEVYLYVQCA